MQGDPGPDEVTPKLAQLRQWVSEPSTDSANLTGLVDELIALQAVDPTEELLETAWDLPTPHLDTAALWIRCRAVKRKWGVSDRLAELVKRGEIGRRGVIAYLRTLGSLNIREGVQLLIQQHGEWLAKESEGWSAAVQALERAGPRYLFFIWAGAWKDHPDADVGALRTVSLAFYKEGRFRAARACMARAYAKADSPELQSALGVWTATELLLRGQAGQGHEVFRLIHRHLLSDDEIVLHRICRAILEVQEAGNWNCRWRATSESKRRLKRALGPLHPRYAPKYVRHFMRRAIQRIAVSSRNPFFALWGVAWMYGWAFEKGFLWFVGISLSLMAVVFAVVGCWGCIIWPIVLALLHLHFKKKRHAEQTRS